MLNNDTKEAAIRIRLEQELKDEFMFHLKQKGMTVSMQVRQWIIAYNRECRKENIYK